MPTPNPPARRLRLVAAALMPLATLPVPADVPAPAVEAAVAGPASAAAIIRVTGAAERVDAQAESVRLRLKEGDGRATVEFSWPSAGLDLSPFRDIAVRMRNGSAAELDVGLNAESDLKLTYLHSAQGRFLVGAGESADLRVLMKRSALPADHPMVQKLGNLFGMPWGHQRHWQWLHTDRILRVAVRIAWAGALPGGEVEVSAPFGQGDYSVDPARLETLELPLVDEFGQMRGAEWPGKLVNAEEFAADAADDRAFVAAHTAPRAGLSRYGGYANGPRLQATGFFRTEKVDGKWWFVDPEGYLFWSHGVNSTANAIETRVEGREELFPESLRGAPDHRPYTENLKRKHGEDGWQGRHVDLTLARMMDWGLNTIGAWSMPELAEARRVPYTLILHTDLQPIGSIKKIVDPFSENFHASLERLFNQYAPKHATSPWLLGVFVHNELDWKNGNELAVEVLRAGRTVAAHRALADFLRGRHGTIEALNAAWGAEFADFDSLRDSGSGPARQQDLKDYTAFFADTFFSACREGMKRHFPNHLFLGCRFHVLPPQVTASATRHCDVVSVNAYRYGITDYSFASDQDRPWLITEFHFGMRDQGHWGVGLTSAADARNQADLYKVYLSEALRHPNFVGAHWFQWTNQTVTGRRDGENFGVGFVSVVDRPVASLVDAVREVSAHLYPYRLNPSARRIGAPDTNR